MKKFTVIPLEGDRSTMASHLCAQIDVYGTEIKKKKINKLVTEVTEAFNDAKFSQFHLFEYPCTLKIPATEICEWLLLVPPMELEQEDDQSQCLQKQL